jgi:hypothetical protein
MVTLGPMAHATLVRMKLHPMNLWWHRWWVHSMELHWFEKIVSCIWWLIVVSQIQTGKIVSITQTNVKRICTSPFGTLGQPKVLGSNPMVFMWNSWWFVCQWAWLGGANNLSSWVYYSASKKKKYVITSHEPLMELVMRTFDKATLVLECTWWFLLFHQQHKSKALLFLLSHNCFQSTISSFGQLLPFGTP